MTELDEYRIKLDEIDSKIISLYEERMNLVKKLLDYKTENNLPILDKSREDLMLKKNLEKISNKVLAKYYPDVLNGFLKASKDYQSDLKSKS